MCEFAILGVQRDRAGCRGAEFDRRADGNGCHCRGGAGFIGSTVVDRLLLDGHAVVAFDDFSTGLERFLEYAVSRREFMLVRGDALDSSALTSAMRGADVVFHLAANADVRFGTNYPRRDLEQNTIATFNVLEAMRENGMRRIVFSSTGSIYGEATVIPTPDDAPFPVQTSLFTCSATAISGNHISTSTTASTPSCSRSAAPGIG